MRSVHPSALLLLSLALFWLAGCGDVAVLHDLPETEANRVLSVLQRHGLEAGKALDDEENNTWSVSVPQQAAGRAWSILAEYKLPRRGDRRFQDVFGQSRLVVTPLEERALYIEALQGEIAHTLETVSGVIDARVHLVLPERDLRGRPMGRPTASVVVEFQLDPGGSEPLGEEQIQGLVAHAVGDLEPADVSVVRKSTAVTASVAGTASGLELVSLGSLVLERGSLERLKIIAAGIGLFVAFLAAVLFWQGVQIHRLRTVLDHGRAGRAGRGATRVEGSSVSRALPAASGEAAS